MSEPFKFRHLNRIVGAFVLTSAAILLAGAVLLGQASHWFERRFQANVQFDRSNLGLLRSGLPVKIQGTVAGEVATAHAEGRHTVVTLSLREDFRKQLRSDAKAILHTPIAGILGETFIEVQPGAGDVEFDPLVHVITEEPGDDLVAQARAAIIAFGGAANELKALLAENRHEVAGAVAGVRRTADQTAALVEENRASIRAGTARIEAIATQVDGLVAAVTPGITATAEALPKTVAQVQETSLRIGATAEASTAAAQAIGGAAEAMRATATSATAVIDGNRARIDASLTELASLLERADAIAADLEKVSRQVADGKGSLGKFVMEDTAHDTAVHAIETLQKRMDELEPVIGSITNLRLFIGVDGGADARSGAATGLVFLRLEPKPWKYYQGGVSYRTAERDQSADIEEDSVVPVDFHLLLGWRFFESEAKDRHHLSLGVGLIESRPGLTVEMPLGTRHLVLTTMARGKHANRDDTDRRHEEGLVLARAAVQAWIWPGHIALTAGANDLVDRPGTWLGLKAELQDNDLKNITQVAALFR